MLGLRERMEENGIAPLTWEGKLSVTCPQEWYPHPMLVPAPVAPPPESGPLGG